jgi:hypothetical protein
MEKFANTNIITNLVAFDLTKARQLWDIPAVELNLPIVQWY